MGEEETTHLSRISFGRRTKNWGHGIISGNSLRLNIADNLNRIAKFKDININSIRSDADYFTFNRINMERSYISFKHTLTDLHLA